MNGKKTGVLPNHQYFHFLFLINIHLSLFENQRLTPTKYSLYLDFFQFFNNFTKYFSILEI